MPEEEEAPQLGENKTPNLKFFTLAELRMATRNFRPDTVVGAGGFGTVFKGWIDGKTYTPSKPGIGMPVAVKKSNDDSIQGIKEWQVIRSNPQKIGIIVYIHLEKEIIVS